MLTVTRSAIASADPARIRSEIAWDVRSASARVGRSAAAGMPLDRFRVRSLSPERRMNVQYQFTWLDADGRQISQGGWRYIVMEPRSQDRFTGNAMDNRASDYRLEIRSAR